MNAPALAGVVLLALASLCRAGQAPPAKAPAQVPDRAVLLQQASDAERAGQSERAMQLLHLAASQYGSVRAWLDLARLQMRATQTVAALDSLSRAREIAPNSEEVLSAYAQVALAARLPLPAVTTLVPLTRMCPGVAEYHYLLGVGLMALGDLPAAVDALRDADRLAPDRPLTLLALGLALNSRKLFDDARAVLLRSLDLDPDKPEAVAALAEAEAGLGDPEAAEAHARRALDRAPSSATANLVIGLVALERRQYPAARDALLAASQADPDAPRVLYQLSLVFARLGDEASSRRYRDLYQAKLKEVEDRIAALRGGGASNPGPRP